MHAASVEARWENLSLKKSLRLGGAGLAGAALLGAAGLRPSSA